MTDAPATNPLVADAVHTDADTDTNVPRVVDHLFRHSAGQVVATLTRAFGPRHLDLVEDVVQETLIKALRQWPHHGVPDRPDAWLFQVARNQALDLLRRERALRDKRESIARELARRSYSGDVSEEALASTLEDDQLRMMFTCCHKVRRHSLGAAKNESPCAGSLSGITSDRNAISRSSTSKGLGMKAAPNAASVVRLSWRR